MTDTEVWPAQAEQDKVSVEIILEGVSDWRELFQEVVELGKPWNEWCGADKVPHLDVCRKVAEVNDVSLERVVLGRLIDFGYILEELEVTFDHDERSGWGLCVWHKEHPSYEDPGEERLELFPDQKGNPRFFSIVYSVFTTEHAGEQTTGILSTQVGGGFLFHKTLIFHRVRFSAPKKAAKVA